jgi:monoamine oxidase
MAKAIPRPGREPYDAVVVGAGFAGLCAARDLSTAGTRVIVVEARDRVGGRTWTRAFPESGELVELGGSWFTPGQAEASAELERYGLTTRRYDLPEVVRWRTGGRLRDGLPVPAEQLGDLEHALVAIAGDARSQADGSLGDVASLSCAEYVERLQVPDEVAEFLTAWYVLIGGAHPARGAVIDALAAIAAHGGTPSSLLTALRFAPAEGWSALAEAMAEPLDIRLSAPAAAVTQSSGGVTVELRGGEALASRVAIVAIPVNVLPHLRFDPSLPPAAAAAAGANAGRAIKLWFRARGVPPASLAAGRGAGVDWLYSDRQLPDGSVLALGFGHDDPGFDPTSRADAEGALHAFWPDAELVAHDVHDWNADPWARGTWLTEPAGRAGLISSASFPPHGRIAFAGADVAPREAGWIAGALASGAEAARWAIDVL